MARRKEQKMMQSECNYTPSSLTETTASSSGASTSTSAGGDSVVESPASSSSDGSKAFHKIDEKYIIPETGKLRPGASQLHFL